MTTWENNIVSSSVAACRVLKNIVLRRIVFHRTVSRLRIQKEERKEVKKKKMMKGLWVGSWSKPFIVTRFSFILSADNRNVVTPLVCCLSLGLQMIPFLHPCFYPVTSNWKIVLCLKLKRQTTSFLPSVSLLSCLCAVVHFLAAPLKTSLFWTFK